MKGGGPQPVEGGRGNFKNLATSQEDEDAFDYTVFRTGNKVGVIGSVAHMVKGALGAGVLSGHVGYMKAGIVPAVILNIIFAFYIGYCLYLLGTNAQILYKRTRVISMSYPDVGEAALACCPYACLAKWSTCLRYCIDVIICIDLFGSCACYQIIIAKTIKQLVEDTHRTSMVGQIPGYPDLRTYLAIMIPALVLICFIRELKFLAPFSIAANMLILLCVGMTIHYAFQYNPGLTTGMVTFRSFYNLLEFTGMSVFSMSSAGVVLPIENNMKEPHKYPTVILIGMSLVFGGVFCVAFFGYAGFLEKCDSPITVNFPMTTPPKILKGCIAFMIYVTHALNFWVPFMLCWYYLEKCHSKSSKLLWWELFYRGVFVTLIGIIAIVFPSIENLMGFLGAFCLSLMAFVWPNMIELLVIAVRPGFGYKNWRLWKCSFLMLIAFFLLICGSFVNGRELIMLVTG